MPGRVHFKNYLSFPLPLSPQRDQVVLERWYNFGLRARHQLHKRPTEIIKFVNKCIYCIQKTVSKFSAVDRVN